MTDPEFNPIVLQLVLDNLTSDTIPDLTSYPCSPEQFLAIKRKVLTIQKAYDDSLRSADLRPTFSKTA